MSQGVLRTVRPDVPFTFAPENRVTEKRVVNGKDVRGKDRPVDDCVCNSCSGSHTTLQTLTHDSLKC